MISGFHRILAIMASFFVLYTCPILVSAEETTDSIIGEATIQDEENADYVTPSNEELETMEGMEVIENVDENGQPFDPTGDLDGKKQFLSFRTADNQTYYLVVTYQGSSSKVHVLKDVNHEDMEALKNVTEAAQAPKAGEATEDNAEELLAEKEDSSVLKDPDEDSEEASGQEDVEKEKESNNTIWVVIAVVIGVLVVGFIKKKKDNTSGYEE